MHFANISIGSCWLRIFQLRIFHHPNIGVKVRSVTGPVQAPPCGQVLHVQSLGSVEVLLRYCSAVHSAALFHFCEKERKNIRKLNFNERTETKYTYEITACGGTTDRIVQFIEKKVPTTGAFIAPHTWFIVFGLKKSRGAIHTFSGFFQRSKLSFGAWNARHGSFKTRSARFARNATFAVIATFGAFRARF